MLFIASSNTSIASFPVVSATRLKAPYTIFCATPVSYTHLDVYKRQAHMLSTFQAALGSQVYNNTDTVVNDSLGIAFLGFIGYLAATVAVKQFVAEPGPVAGSIKYIVLIAFIAVAVDVYKRQVMTSPSFICFEIMALRSAEATLSLAGSNLIGFNVTIYIYPFFYLIYLLPVYCPLWSAASFSAIFLKYASNSPAPSSFFPDFQLSIHLLNNISSSAFSCTFPHTHSGLRLDMTK